MESPNGERCEFVRRARQITASVSSQAFSHGPREVWEPTRIPRARCTANRDTNAA